MFALVRGWKTVDFAITVCTDELGPVVPRTFPSAPGWSTKGHRIKAPLDYSRGPEKTWVYGALRVRDGKELTRCAASRNSTNSIALLSDIEADNATGDIFIIDFQPFQPQQCPDPRLVLSSILGSTMSSFRKEQARLNLQEGWWRLFRRDAAFGSERGLR